MLPETPIGSEPHLLLGLGSKVRQTDAGQLLVTAVSKLFGQNKVYKYNIHAVGTT